MTLSANQAQAWQVLGLGPIPASTGQIQEAIETTANRELRPSTGNDWDGLANQVSQCTLCALCSSRKSTVFGTGSRKASWLLVGESPSEQDELEEDPFTGAPGQLLNAILRSIGLTRETDVYITNVIKCRPPNNRDPLANEALQCAAYLQQQMLWLQPKKIILLGRFAAQTVLQTDATLTSLRGRAHTVDVAGQDLPAVVAYHPSYLLRTPRHKNRAWQDWLLAKNI